MIGVSFSTRDGLVGLGSVGDVAIARALLAGERAHGDSPERFLIGRIVARDGSAIAIHWSSRPSEARAGTHNHHDLLQRLEPSEHTTKPVVMGPRVRGDDGEPYSAAVARRLRARAVALVDVVDHQRLEVGGDVGAAQGAELLAVDEHRRGRRFAGARQRDADIGVLGFAGAVDDAAHDRDVERSRHRDIASSSPAFRSRMKSWIERASSWNTVEVVRPQPGQAATSGTKVRKPMVCSSSCATCTSSVRSPPGSGVSEMRMVSPMPSCSRMPSAADEATMPFDPMPASVRPRWMGVVGTRRRASGRPQSGPAPPTPSPKG